MLEGRIEVDPSALEVDIDSSPPLMWDSFGCARIMGPIERDIGSQIQVRISGREDDA